MTPAQLRRAATVCREVMEDALTGRINLGTFTFFNTDGTPCCALGHVMARTDVIVVALPRPGRDDVSMANDRAEPADRPWAVAFHLLSLADTLDEQAAQ